MLRVLLVFWIAGVVVVAGCSPKLDYTHNSEEIESMIATSFEADTGIAVKRVKCPDNLSAGGKIVCQLHTVSNKQIELHVTLDGKSSEWEAPGIVLSKKLDPLIVSQFSKKGVTGLKPSCPEFVTAETTTFTCPATWKGSNVEVSVKVTGKNQYEFRTPWIDVSATLRTLTRKVRAQSPRAPELACDDLRIPPTPGLRLECRAGDERVILVVQPDGKSFTMAAANPKLDAVRPK